MQHGGDNKSCADPSSHPAQLHPLKRRTPTLDVVHLAPGLLTIPETPKINFVSAGKSGVGGKRLATVASDRRGEAILEAKSVKTAKTGQMRKLGWWKV